MHSRAQSPETQLHTAPRVHTAAQSQPLSTPIGASKANGKQMQA